MKRRNEEKLDTITSHISSIDTTLAAQHQSLKDHIRRTEILESQIKPIEKHVSMVNGALKLIGVLAMLGAIVEGIMSVIHK